MHQTTLGARDAIVASDTGELGSQWLDAVWALFVAETLGIDSSWSCFSNAGVVAYRVPTAADTADTSG